MLGLFPGSLFPVQTDLRIAFAVRHSGHGQVHTNLAALAVKILTQTVYDLGIHTLGHADYMLGSPGHLAVHLFKLGSRRLTNGAELGSLVALMNITADGANIFRHICILLFSNDSCFLEFIISLHAGLSIEFYKNLFRFCPSAFLPKQVFFPAVPCRCHCFAWYKMPQTRTYYHCKGGESDHEQKFSEQQPEQFPE